MTIETRHIKMATAQVQTPVARMPRGAQSQHNADSVHDDSRKDVQRIIMSQTADWPHAYRVHN